MIRRPQGQASLAKGGKGIGANSPSPGVAPEPRSIAHFSQPTRFRAGSRHPKTLAISHSCRVQCGNRHPALRARQSTPALPGCVSIGMQVLFCHEFLPICAAGGISSAAKTQRTPSLSLRPWRLGGKIHANSWQVLLAFWTVYLQRHNSFPI